MLFLALGIAAAGIALFIGAPVLARLFLGRDTDRVALTRVLQAIGVILLVAALVLAPYNPDNTAVPPPPEGPDPRAS